MAQMSSVLRGSSAKLGARDAHASLPQPKVMAPCCRPAARLTVRAMATDNKKSGVLVKAKDHVAVGGMDNPGSPEVRARIDSGGRLPNGKKKTAIITGASSGLGLHTAKVLVKTGDWNVICAVRDKAKMEKMAQALEFPQGSYSIREVDLKSLDSVRKLCRSLTAPELLG